MMVSGFEAPEAGPAQRERVRESCSITAAVATQPLLQFRGREKRQQLWLSPEPTHGLLTLVVKSTGEKMMMAVVKTLLTHPP